MVFLIIFVEVSLMLISNSGNTGCRYSSPISSSTGSIFCIDISGCTKICGIFSFSGIDYPFYLHFSKTSFDNYSYNVRRTSRNDSHNSRSSYSKTNSSSIYNSLMPMEPSALGWVILFLIRSINFCM